MVGMGLNAILNFLPIDDRLATAGQPTHEQLAGIAEAGYQLVINLTPQDSANALPGEADIVARHGMRYEYIPVVWESPQLEDLRRFFEVMAENRARRVFVHCAMNLRVSTFVYLYRMLRENVPEPEAAIPLNEMWGRVAAYAKDRPPTSTAVMAANSFYQPEGTWRRFINEALQAQSWREPGQAARVCSNP